MKIVIRGFTIDNSQYLTSSPQGCGSTCSEAFDDALDFIAQGGGPEASYIQDVSQEEIDRVYREFWITPNPTMVSEPFLNAELNRIYEEIPEGESAEVWIYCWVDVR